MASIAALRAVGGRAATRAAAGPALWRLSRPLHVTASAFSSKNPGPVETKLRAEIAAAKPGPEMDVSVVAAAAPGAKVYSAKIKRLADEIVNLTMLESMDLSDAMRERLGFSKSDLLFPGVGFGGGGMPAGGAQAAAAAPAGGAAKAAAAPAKEEKKEEKTHVDIKLKGFPAANKIKVIKEIRGVTNLGLKEAKDLVEGVPCTILQKVKKEDAAKMIEKLKADCGAEFELV